ncbi:DUF2254 domain-containing protein [Cellulophaga tyrosinoxydans]|uniref:Uncharacterized membrane protein n=1 Tax=Cellulophaga tyrosinoxydans TaxID=504486 RepID=A0A1W1YK13_9FLAO|nr:DUF2254 domain-containing protein [Cellulophaga tyrosinoxydans]SMC36494.1 Uncharacterized membrane protein [Cellulophaga tyrosinoxydans]
MVRSLFKYLKITYFRILESIAFYPVLLCVIFLLLAGVTTRIENVAFILKIKSKLPHLFISDYETSRSILTTLVGGILSLTVFSFSMVMVVLNQASTNYSPRLLPSLIANKKHQIILGFYIGTLLYCIFVLIILGANGSDSVGLSTMLAALFGVFCIGLFVYFIHNISTTIQINNIIDGIYNSSKKSLENRFKAQKLKTGLKVVDASDFKLIHSAKSGYFINFDSSLLTDDFKNQQLQIHILPYLNQHIWQGDVIAKVSKQLSDEAINALLFCFNISKNRHSGNEGISGLIKLMEIAVKAMSPGINDPGTSIEAINSLGKLMYKIVDFPEVNSSIDENSDLIIVTHNVRFDELLRVVVQPIRFYAKEDCSVLYQLIKSLKFIATNPNISLENKKCIITTLDLIRADSEKYIQNSNDKLALFKAFE